MMSASTPSHPTEFAQAYLRAWADGDADAVSRQFAPDGTYVDPTLPGPLRKEEIAGFVASLVTAFSGLTFEYESISSDDNRVIAQWRMKGTHTGPMPGLPEPTGRTVDLPGVDVITVGQDGITSAVNYLDRITFLAQLGLEVRIVPAAQAATS